METSMDKMWIRMNEDSMNNIFSINDFSDIANNNTIRSNLMRMTNDKKIVKLIDGFYAVPKYSKLLDMNINPNADELAKKIAEKFLWNIVPTDESALNLTGLSTQVPNHYVYASDGPYRKYRYNGVEIIFKNTSKKYLKNISKNTALMVQAMKVIGKDNFTEKELKKLSRFYKKNINTNIINEINNIPVWMREKFIEIVGS